VILEVLFAVPGLIFQISPLISEGPGGSNLSWYSEGICEVKCDTSNNVLARLGGLRSNSCWANSSWSLQRGSLVN
jgi:hypothetical protein